MRLVYDEGRYNYSKANRPCGDRIKHKRTKLLEFENKSDANLFARFLMSSDLCDCIKVKGKTVRWRTYNKYSACYTFRISRCFRSEVFIKALQEAFKYEEDVNPVISIGYFWSKQRNNYRQTIDRARDMLWAGSNFYQRFMSKSNYKKLKQGDRIFFYSRLYQVDRFNPPPKFKDVLKEWNES